VDSKDGQQEIAIAGLALNGSSTLNTETVPADTNDHLKLKLKLKLSFHGRIIDHLGIQMYQSPVAAIAEMVSNGWDAEAENVKITLPISTDKTATFQVYDDGVGMTFDQCQQRFLVVGRNRRSNYAEFTTEKHRPVLGRKGIGKFAGFGIAKTVRVDTISKETGERTVFELDLDQLRGDEYIQKDGDIEVLLHEPPNEARKIQHSTTITLANLTIRRTPNVSQFSLSMARRFGLRNQLQDFKVSVDGEPLVDPEQIADVDMLYPRDYSQAKLDEYGIQIDGEWGVEKLADGNSIRWRIAFYKKPIADDDLRGISVFAHVKLAQRPFDFNVTGVTGEHGLVYMAGRVQADYIDSFADDLIAPERQRINWTVDETGALLVWGQKRVRELLALWRDKRGKAKIDAIQTRMAPFATRLARRPPHERKIIEAALRKLASMAALDEDDFLSLSQSIIVAWEGERLRDLIYDIGQAENMEAGDLVKILVEAKVLTSLHTAEAVKAKVDLLVGLHERIRKRELENDIRDYIAENPWMIDHRWETFQVEKSVENVCKAAALEAKLDDHDGWKKRVDLVMSSNSQLLVMEFMRPGLTIDRDHINRFEEYIQAIETQLEAQTGNQFDQVSGLLVADKLNKNATTVKKLKELKKQNMEAVDWEYLLARAADRWKEFLGVLIDRAPDDTRLSELATHLGYAPKHVLPDAVQVEGPPEPSAG
jgi:Histidine kinase-, DNA gyrase B-, and HSP90-like ATPase